MIYKNYSEKKTTIKTIQINLSSKKNLMLSLRLKVNRFKKFKMNGDNY